MKMEEEILPYGFILSKTNVIRGVIKLSLIDTINDIRMCCEEYEANGPYEERKAIILYGIWLMKHNVF